VKGVGNNLINRCYIGRRAGSSAVAQLVNHGGTKRFCSPQKTKFTGPKHLGTCLSPEST
jgi:hypothetical protein